MKSPAELNAVLRRQWHNRALREARLLGIENAWPIVVAIGRPSPIRLRNDLDALRRHIESWRRVKVGEVIWRPVRYRSTSDDVEIPAAWKLRKPGEWIEACGDAAIRKEFESLAFLAEQTNVNFHPLFVRRRSTWRDKPLAEVALAAKLAMQLTPGITAGKPR
jgi:hypothetical protein